MGRGLSPLQRWILQKASERGCLYYAEICAEFYGLSPLPPRRDQN
jgi:hypothetical protein